MNRLRHRLILISIATGRKLYSRSNRAFLELLEHMVAVFTLRAATGCWKALDPKQLTAALTLRAYECGGPAREKAPIDLQLE